MADGHADRQSGAEASESTRRSDDGSDEHRQPGTAEKAMMVVSLLFTLAILAYASWQVVAAPAETPAPEARVVGTETLSDGRVAVTVEFRNPKNRGLVTATVESQCASPPPSIQFSYLPADSMREGTLVCPPGTENPGVSVSNWVEA